MESQASGRDDSAGMTVGVVQLPFTATRMADADEEVFLLYTGLAAQTNANEHAHFRGLGHVDSHEDVLTVSFAISKPMEEDFSQSAPSSARRRGRPSQRPSRKKNGKHEEDTFDVEIAQDKTALRSRKGDTGSVLWHASVDLAQALLWDLHQKNPTRPFLNRDHLSAACVVELGAGTGMLGVVLSPFVKQYIATDIAALVPLIRKNLTRNRQRPAVPSSSNSKHSPLPPVNSTAETLDWLDVHNALPSFRPNLVPSNPADLVLVVDCIYHPSLLPALLTTINHLAIPGKTTVMVVVELRAEDVVREFLQGWLDMSLQESWEIWSVGDLMKGPYAVWVGQKVNV
ncbi:putative methyltransferase-domain-containing protein [Epithele typhae]|uniref:putative methyltransferase-domain-containing protein n=1 Tax=Epithele typhae TaxID=378194 RepID=UPI0020089808|nr:putative methyltransferase-domain-containing protein [Epithele typhae]KAH9940427.1 putative methyltransferase-domain-containing protein [Epithele typhae]